MMTLDEYLEWTDTIAVYPKEIEKTYLALGLCGEAGEISEKLKKMLRDGKDDRDALLLELGDVMWYWVRICGAYDWSPAWVSMQDPGKISYHRDIHLLTLSWIASIGQVGHAVASEVTTTVVDPKMIGDLAKVYAQWEQMCFLLETKPSEVIQRNIEKLESRKIRSVLHGSGDNR